jgi:hypothetical protein
MGGVGAGAVTAVAVVIGLAFLTMGVGMPFLTIRRARQATGALRQGLTAEGRVLDTYVTHRQDRASERHVIIGFRAADGREYRIEDSGNRPRVVGDHVPVRYLPDRPDLAVPADTSVGALAGVSVVVCVFGGVFAVAGLVVLLLGLTGVLLVDSVPDPSLSDPSLP